MLQHYFKSTLRNLLRNKIYSAINIVGLSLGLASAMLIILYTNDELSYDRFHANVANIYRIGHNRVNPDGSIESRGGNTGYFQGPSFNAAVPEVKSFVRLTGYVTELKQGSEITSELVYAADSNFFSVFDFPLISGDPQTALGDPRSVVISEATALRIFGKTDVLGMDLYLKANNAFEPYAITGVSRNCPDNSSIKFNIIAPLKVDANDESWADFFLNTFVVLEAGANVNDVETKMKQVYEKEARETILNSAVKYNNKTSIVHVLQPLTDIHLSKIYKADNGLKDASDPMYSYILSGIALFILLIACINFVNLTIARSVKRAKEIGIRKVVGGDKRQLMIQFLGESYLLCLAAFLLALVLVQTVLPFFNQLSNKVLFLSYLLNVRMVLAYAGLFLITGMLAGFYPAMILSGYHPVRSLYNGLKLGKVNLQKGLIVLQFALSTLLVMATIIVYSQFNYLINTDLGYDQDNVIIIRKPGLTHRDANLLKTELLKNPDILYVSARNGGREGTSAKISGDIEAEFDYETIDESYFPLYKIPVVQGRNFSSKFPSDGTHAIVVNETFVKNAGWKEPIGQEVNFWYRNNEKYTVVGVVKDYHYLPLNQEIGPQIFTMSPARDYGLALVRINPDHVADALAYIQKTFNKVFPMSLYQYEFKTLEYQKSYNAEAKWKKVMMFGAGFTIFISCIGLFGMSVLAAEKRTKEIGIRKVLGASVAAAVTLLTKDFLKLIVLSLLIAMPAAWQLATQWLQYYPYHIQLNAFMFAFAAVFVVVVSLATVSFQAFKAAWENPVKALRSE
jgi:putative ABC transport system permease protein